MDSLYVDLKDDNRYIVRMNILSKTNPFENLNYLDSSGPSDNIVSVIFPDFFFSEDFEEVHEELINNISIFKRKLLELNGTEEELFEAGYLIDPFREFKENIGITINSNYHLVNNNLILNKVNNILPASKRAISVVSSNMHGIDRKQFEMKLRSNNTRLEETTNIEIIHGRMGLWIE